MRGGTYFSLQRQRKVGKRKPLKPPAPATVHLWPFMPVAPERLSPRTTQVSDKGLIHPAARYARCGRVCKGNRALRVNMGGNSYAPTVLGYALRRAQRRRKDERLVTPVEGEWRQTLRSHWQERPEVNCGGHWRFERLSFAYFSLPLQRKVGAAPHRGNTGIPTRLQGKAKAPGGTAQHIPKPFKPQPAARSTPAATPRAAPRNAPAS